MAEENLNENLNILIDVSGADGAAAILDGVINTVNTLTGASQKLENVQTRGSQNYLKALKDIYNQNVKMQDEYEKSVRNFKSGFQSLTSEIKSIKSTFLKVIGLITGSAGFTGAIKTVREYGNTLASISATTRRFGLSMKGLTDAFERISGQLTLTREQTSELFKAYQEVPLESVKGFESILSNIQTLVGSNAEEMQKYMQSVTSLIQKFPELQSAIEGTGDAQRGQISNVSRLLFLNGELSKQEYMRLQAYSDAGKILDAESEAARNLVKENQRMTQQMQKFFEDMKLTLGKILIPYVKEFVNWLNNTETRGAIDKFINGFKEVATTVANIIRSLGGIKSLVIGIGIAFASIKITKIALSFVQMAKAAKEMAKHSQGINFAGFTKRAAIGGLIASGGALAGGALHAYGEGQGGYSGGVGATLATAGGTVLSGAGYGAAVGTMIAPGIGTAIGAASGAVVGLAKAAWDASSGLNDLKNKLDKDAAHTIEVNTTAIIRDMKVDDIIKMQNENIKRSRSRYGASVSTAQKESNLKADVEKLAVLDKKLKPISDKLSEYNRRLSIRRDALSKVANDTEREAIEKNIRIEEGKINKLLRDNNIPIKEREELAKRIRHGEEMINTEYIKRRMQLDGLKSQQESIHALANAELYLLQQQAQYNGENLNKYQKQSLDILSKRSDLLQKNIDEQRKIVAQAEKGTNNLAERAKAQQKLNSLLNDQRNLNKEYLDMQLINTHLHDERIKTVQAETQYYSDLVSLADSFGMGIGASVEARANVVKLLEQQKSLVRDSLREAIKEYEKAQKSGKNEQAARQRVLDLRKEELGITRQQADMTKQMREGWVSAIQSMTTGTGKFTKIAMDANKNMATQLGVLGIVEHAMSGSTRTGYKMGNGAGQGAMRWGIGGIGSTSGQMNAGMAYLNRMGSTSPADLARSVDSYVAGGINKMAKGGQFFAGMAEGPTKSALYQKGIPDTLKKTTVSPSSLGVKGSGALYNSMRGMNDMIGSANAINTSGRTSGNTYININVNSSDPSGAAREIVKKVGKYISRGGNVITNGYTK